MMLYDICAIFLYLKNLHEMCETAAEKNRHTVPAGSRNYKEYDKNPKRPDLFRNCREKLKKL